MSTCLRCGGSKHIFVEKILKEYPGTTVRFYKGKCDRCNCDGKVTIPIDSKKKASGEITA
jgi:hypothetical protein